MFYEWSEDLDVLRYEGVDERVFEAKGALSFQMEGGEVYEDEITLLLEGSFKDEDRERVVEHRLEFEGSSADHELYSDGTVDLYIFHSSEKCEGIQVTAISDYSGRDRFKASGCASSKPCAWPQNWTG